VSKKTDLETHFDTLIRYHQPQIQQGMHTQYRFHHKRLWRADRAWPDAMVLVELDGGTWTGGYHTSGAGYDKDAEKHIAAMSMGYIVVRLSSSMLAPERAASFLSLLAHLISTRYLVAGEICQTIPPEPPAETYQHLTPARGKRTSTSTKPAALAGQNVMIAPRQPRKRKT
jgi:very-short-patch-repair endonuclease